MVQPEASQNLKSKNKRSDRKGSGSVCVVGFFQGLHKRKENGKKQRDCFEPKRFSHLLKDSTLSIHIALFFCRILLHIQPKSGCNLSRKRPATPNCVRLHSHESHCCTNAKLIWKRFLPPPEPIYKWKAIKSLKRGFAS